MLNLQRDNERDEAEEHPQRAADNAEREHVFFPLMRAVDQDRERDLEDRSALEDTLDQAEREVVSAKRSRKPYHCDRIALADDAVYRTEDIAEQDADQASPDIERQPGFFMKGF